MQWRLLSLSYHRPSQHTDNRLYSRPTNPTLTRSLLSSNRCPAIWLQTQHSLIVTLIWELTAADLTDQPKTICPEEEEGELLDKEQNLTSTDIDQALLEGQTYQETMGGVNPSWDGHTCQTFTTPCLRLMVTCLPGQSSNQQGIQSNYELMNCCVKNLVEDNPSKNLEAGGLHRSQYVKTAKSQSKLYNLYTDKEKNSINVNFWYKECARLNSSYSRIVRSSGLSSTPMEKRQHMKPAIYVTITEYPGAEEGLRMHLGLWHPDSGCC